LSGISANVATQQQHGGGLNNNTVFNMLNQINSVAAGVATNLAASLPGQDGKQDTNSADPVLQPSSLEAISGIPQSLA